MANLLTEMVRHAICEEWGCQLKEGKGYPDCEHHSVVCDLLRSLPVGQPLQPEAQSDALALGCGLVPLPLAGRNPDVYTHAGGVFYGGSTPLTLGLHGDNCTHAKDIDKSS